MPGLNNSAYRCVPNWLVSCWLNTLSSWPWMALLDIDGSKTITLGPREPPPGSGGPGGAVQAQVPAGAGNVQRLAAAPARLGGVDARPGGRVGGDLDLLRGGVGGFPGEYQLADLLGAAQVDPDPLWIGELAGPAGTGVAVHRCRRRCARSLHGRGGGWVVQGGVGRTTATRTELPVHLELPQRVPVRGRARRAVYA